MKNKPQFLETDLIFQAFEDACNGKQFNISKPEEKWIGKILDYTHFEDEPKNIANKAIRQFLKEQSDIKCFRDNNHIGFKKQGRSFQIINLFPEVDLNPPSIFVWEDDENYYLYTFNKVVARINTNYLIRLQPDSGNLKDQYFYNLPLSIIIFEVNEPKKYNRKEFVNNWITFHNQKDGSFKPLQRALEESLLTGKGKTYDNFNPSEILDMFHQGVDYFWSKEEHKTNFSVDINRSLSSDSFRLLHQFIKNCRNNIEIQEQLTGTKSEFKSELLDLNLSYNFNKDILRQS